MSIFGAKPLAGTEDMLRGSSIPRGYHQRMAESVPEGTFLDDDGHLHIRTRGYFHDDPAEAEKYLHHDFKHQRDLDEPMSDEEWDRVWGNSPGTSSQRESSLRYAEEETLLDSRDEDGWPEQLPGDVILQELEKAQDQVGQALPTSGGVSGGGGASAAGEEAAGVGEAARLAPELLALARRRHHNSSMDESGEWPSGPGRKASGQHRKDDLSGDDASTVRDMLLGLAPEEAEELHAQLLRESPHLLPPELREAAAEARPEWLAEDGTYRMPERNPKRCPQCGQTRPEHSYDCKGATMEDIAQSYRNFTKGKEASSFKGIDTRHLVKQYGKPSIVDTDYGDALLEELHNRAMQGDRDAARTVLNDYDVNDDDWTPETGHF